MTISDSTSSSGQESESKLSSSSSSLAPAPATSTSGAGPARCPSCPLSSLIPEVGVQRSFTESVRWEGREMDSAPPDRFRFCSSAFCLRPCGPAVVNQRVLFTEAKMK
ncbi:hypothetical protein BC936DRAFT_147393 [Jimgerdemannia flammicorona]|uniref:Uncharacterized protein n=1 Tax=Jimgerdemannia flammicorona TaxID=994334 RepID=A0A433D5G2_9FUNG|nr:hypothetical protein BC936DRAFT_147393 [Jimgerdemannia flammicorona]